MVTSVTNIFSLATKNFGLVTTLATRFLYDLDLKLKQTFHRILLFFCRKKCAKSHKQSQFRGRLGTAAVLAVGLYLNHRGVLYSTANDPQPQMIPRRQMIPKMDRK